MTDYCLRPYRPSDWLRLCEIHDPARHDELTLAGVPEAFQSLEDTAESEGLFDGALIVAEAENIVRGFVSYTLDQLGWIYTDPAYSRRGIGRKLVRHTIMNTGPVLELEVLEGNIPAIALYESEGFVEINRKTGSVSGNDGFIVTGLIMQRRR